MNELRKLNQEPRACRIRRGKGFPIIYRIRSNNRPDGAEVYSKGNDKEGECSPTGDETWLRKTTTEGPGIECESVGSVDEDKYSCFEGDEVSDDE